MMGIKKTVLGFAIVALFAATGANAGNGGNGSGNPKNDAGHPTKEAVARYVWKDGKLVPNPKRAEDRHDGIQVTVSK